MKDARDRKSRVQEKTVEQQIWGAGAKQHENEKQRAEEEAEKAAAPFALNEDDPRYQERRRAELRIEDPMLNLLDHEGEDPMAVIQKKGKKDKKDKKDKKQSKKEARRKDKEIAEKEAERLPVCRIVDTSF